MPSCCCRDHLLTVVSEWMSGEVGMHMSLCVGVGDIYDIYREIELLFDKL